jgi:tetratricopeptide (TPR) repeat protein
MFLSPTRPPSAPVNQWPFSDYAPQAQYLIGRCYEEKGQDKIAFKHYQTLIEKYPKIEIYPEVLQRQFEIANRFLGGRWDKLWGYIPIPPSKDKTADMFEKVVKNGPYSEVGPQAQMKIGATREKQKDYPKGRQSVRARGGPLFRSGKSCQRRDVQGWRRLSQGSQDRGLRPIRRIQSHRHIPRFLDVAPE